MCLCDRANSPARGPQARAGPGPHILDCFAGRAGPGHTCCGPGRARASEFNLRAGPGQSLHNCCGPGPGLGLKSYLRAGPGPRFQARAGH